MRRGIVVIVLVALATGCRWRCFRNLVCGQTAVIRAATDTISLSRLRPTDVEVAVMDGKGAVVRHLAAGALEQCACALRKQSRARIVWDGRDDQETRCQVSGSGGDILFPET